MLVRISANSPRFPPARARTADLRAASVADVAHSPGFPPARARSADRGAGQSPTLRIRLAFRPPARTADSGAAAVADVLCPERKFAPEGALSG
jgi:hypothetical protein